VTALASIADVQVVEANSGAKNVVLMVTLSQPATGPVKIGYATADGTATSGTDYVAATGTVSFAAGAVSKTITVAIVGDRVAEPAETFDVTLTGVTQGPALIDRSTAHVAITDTD
jgi:chitinase